MTEGKHPSGLRELLIADLALELEFAAPGDVAAALKRFWDVGGKGDVSFIDELARMAELSPVAVEILTEELRRVLDECGGDIRAVMGLRGGIDRSIHSGLPAEGPVSPDVLEELGVGMRSPLRVTDPDRYCDFRQVGVGGMGVVYLAIDTDLNRQVAFKIVRPLPGDTAGDEEDSSPFEISPPESPEEQGTPASQAFRQLTRRFLQEALVTGGLDHPGIVPVYELGRTPGGIAYYTMRFVRGDRTFEQAIGKARNLDERLSLLEPFLKLCDTVRYAHSQGVIHRDLKPANVALGEFGEVVLLDWGLARIEDRPDGVAHPLQERVREYREAQDLQTVAGAMGTPGYMAPEAAFGHLELVDFRSDVYSLGVILYEILTGLLPHRFRTFKELIEKLRSGPPLEPEFLEPHAPHGLSGLCMEALAADRDERIASVADFTTAIREWRDESTKQREIEALLAEARAGLEGIESLDGEAQLRQLDRSSAHVGRVFELSPDNPEATALYDRTRKIREQAGAIRESAARRQTLRRAAAVAAALLLLVAGIAAYLLDQRYRDAETARVAEAEARGRAEDAEIDARASAELAKRETVAKDLALRRAQARTLLFVAKDLIAGHRITEALSLALEAWRMVPDDKEARDLCEELERRPLETGRIEAAHTLEPLDDGSLLVTGRNGLPRLLYDPDSGRELPGWERHQVRPAVADEGARPRGDGEGRLVLGGRVRNAHIGRIPALAVSSEGSRVLTAGLDQRVRVWDAAGEPVRELEGLRDWPVEMGAAILGEGDAYVVATRTEILFWDRSGELLTRQPFAVRLGAVPDRIPLGEEHVSSALLFVPASSRDRVVAVAQNGAVRVFDPRGRVVRDLASGFFSEFCAVSPDRSTFALTTMKPGLAVTTVDGTLLRVFDASEEPNGVTLDNAGEHLAAWFRDGSVIAVDLRTNAPARLLKTEGAPIRGALALSGGTVATLERDGLIRLWPGGTDEDPHLLEPNLSGSEVRHLMDSGGPDRILAVAARSGSFQHAAAWDQAGKLLAVEFDRFAWMHEDAPSEYPGPIPREAARIPLCWNRTLLLRDRDGAVRMSRNASPGMRPTTPVVSADGDRLAVHMLSEKGRGPSTLMVMNLKEDRATGLDLPTGSEIRGMSFMPDGHGLIAMVDNVVHLIDPDRNIHREIHRTSLPGGFSLSPSGRYLAVWGNPGESAILALDGSEVPPAPSFEEALFSPSLDIVALRTGRTAAVFFPQTGETVTPPLVSAEEAWRLGWSTDGREVVVSEGGAFRTLDLDSSEPRWSVAEETGRPIGGSPVLDRSHNRVWFSVLEPPGNTHPVALRREISTPPPAPPAAEADAPVPYRLGTLFAPVGRADGSLLVVPGAPGEVLFLDGEGKARASLNLTAGAVRQALFADGGRRVVLLLEDGRLLVLDERAQPLAERVVPVGGRLRAACGGRRLLHVSDGELRILDLQLQSLARYGMVDLGHVRDGEEIRDSHDRESILVPLRHGYAEIGIDGTVRRRFPGAGSAAYARDDGGVVALHGDGRLWLYPADGEREELRSGADGRTKVAVSPDGRSVATLDPSGNGTILHLDGSDPVTFGPALPQADLHFLAEGRTLLAAGVAADERPRVAIFGADGATLRAPEERAEFISISPPGNRVLVRTGKTQKWSLRLLDERGTELASFPSVYLPVSLGWSPDGRRFLLGAMAHWGELHRPRDRPWISSLNIIDADGNAVAAIAEVDLEPGKGNNWYRRAWLTNRHAFIPAETPQGSNRDRGHHEWTLRDVDGKELLRQAYDHTRFPPAFLPDRSRFAHVDGLRVTVRKPDGTITGGMELSSRPIGLGALPDGRGFVVVLRSGLVVLCDPVGRRAASLDLGEEVMGARIISSTGLVCVETKQYCRFLQPAADRSEFETVLALEGKSVGEADELTFVAHLRRLTIVDGRGGRLREESFEGEVRDVAWCGREGVWVAGLSNGLLVIGTDTGIERIQADTRPIEEVRISPDGGAVVSRLSLERNPQEGGGATGSVHTRVWSRDGRLLRELTTSDRPAWVLDLPLNFHPLRFLAEGLLQSGDEYLYLEPEALARSLEGRGVRAISLKSIPEAELRTAVPRSRESPEVGTDRYAQEKLSVQRYPADRTIRLRLIAAAVARGDGDGDLAVAEGRAAAEKLGGEVVDWVAASDRYLRPLVGAPQKMTTEEVLQLLRKNAPNRLTVQVPKMPDGTPIRQMAEAFRAAWPEIEALAPATRAPHYLDQIRNARRLLDYEGALELCDRLTALVEKELARPDAPVHWMELRARITLERGITLGSLGRSEAAGAALRELSSLALKASSSSVTLRLLADQGQDLLDRLMATIDDRPPTNPLLVMHDLSIWMDWCAWPLAARCHEALINSEHEEIRRLTRHYLGSGALTAALAALQGGAMRERWLPRAREWFEADLQELAGSARELKEALRRREVSPGRYQDEVLGLIRELYRREQDVSLEILDEEGWRKQQIESCRRAIRK